MGKNVVNETRRTLRPVHYFSVVDAASTSAILAHHFSEDDKCLLFFIGTLSEELPNKWKSVKEKDPDLKPQDYFEVFAPNLFQCWISGTNVLYVKEAKGRSKSEGSSSSSSSSSGAKKRKTL